MYELMPIKNDIVIDGFHSIYYFEHGKNFSHNPEKHNFWEIVYVDEGEIVVIADGVGRNLSQGQVVFHKPNEVHAHLSDKKSGNNMLVISFTAKGDCMKFFENKIFTLNESCKFLLSLFVDEATSSIGSRPEIYESSKTTDFSALKFGGTQMLSCYFIEFLIKLIRGSESMTSKDTKLELSRALASNSIMKLVSEYMENNLYNNLSLEKICAEFMTGKSHLTVEFKKYFGKTPMEYYRSLKLKEAKKLLKSENYSVSEISDMLGYSSIHMFSRAFKKEIGFSPKKYQKSVLYK